MDRNEGIYSKGPNFDLVTFNLSSERGQKSMYRNAPSIHWPIQRVFLTFLAIDLSGCTFLHFEIEILLESEISGGV